MTPDVLREEQMTPDYRRLVVQLMESQAYRELAAAHMFGYGLRFVPEKWMKFMVWHIQEETEHYQAVAKMYREFTREEVEPHVGAGADDGPDDVHLGDPADRLDRAVQLVPPQVPGARP